MVSEKFPAAASDQYAETNSSPNTLHRLSPSMTSKGQLPVSSTWNSQADSARFSDLLKERNKTYSHDHQFSHPTNY